VPDAPYRLLTPPGSPSLTTVAAYRAQGGYGALQQTVSRATPAQALETIRASGLRGRGGAGVWAAEKLSLVAEAPVGQKYIVCNAYDADDRSLIAKTLLRQNPHSVIEGMALAGFAAGATEGFLFMRGEDGALAASVRDALREAAESGILGRGILGSPNAFSITLVGADVGFMGGEESTLIQVIKGRPAKAQQRPPYPTTYGVFDKPTAVLNVETLANLPLIFGQGGAAYKRVGSQATPGTKLLTVIDANGAASLVEVPFGTTARDALRAAGVSLGESTTRGAVVGGWEGGVLPASQLGVAIDFETLEDVGAILGSAVIEVLPQSTCMVRWAAERSAYLSRETCGKCVPCRVGVKRIAGTLEGIASGLGTQDDLALLDEFSHYVPDGSLCGFGVNAVHPVVTAMKYFADDFTAHLEGRCPTETCLPTRAHRYVTKHVL
jgi:NADH:ubiquinone oxidoreductase subunit F (NADH-binding)